MFDEKELIYLQEMETRITEQSAASMRIILENVYEPHFKALFEKLDMMEEKMVTVDALDEIEERLNVLEATVKQHTHDIAELKKAQ